MSVDTLKDAASVLQEADVSAIVTSLALGIAEAQEQLDNNSIKQTLALADPNNGVGGKSLLELGFTPAFYHFQYADISASISLKMKLKTELELDVSISAYYTSQGGYSKEKLDYLKETEDASYRKEFRSSREFVTSANSAESYKVDNATVTINQEQGAKTKISKFQDQLHALTNVDRARYEMRNENSLTTTTENNAFLQYVDGYLVVALPYRIADDWAILQINNYTSTAVEVATGTGFNIDVNYDTTYTAADAANGGTVIGFSKAGFKLGTGTTVSLNVYFGFDKDQVDYAYSQGGVSNTDPNLKKAMRVLVEILKKDPSAQLNVIGHTDGSGPDPYNDDLSLRRANAVRKELLEYDKSIGARITPIGKGEDDAPDENPNENYRKVEIKLTTDNDYLYFEGGNLVFDQTSPTAGTATDNGFIEAQDGKTPGSTIPTVGLEFNFGAAVISETGMTTRNAVKTALEALDKFSFEERHDKFYLLHDETEVKWSVMSKTSQELSIERASESSSSGLDSENTVLVDQNQNSLTKILKDAEKIENPSTFAVGGSVDFRMARQFEMSVEGSSSVSARLVSLPAPPEFLDEIKSFLSN